MSSDDAYFVQQNKEGKFTAQWGSMSNDELPDPEKTDPKFIFNNIDELVRVMARRAYETEYGFHFHIPALIDWEQQ